MTSTRIWLKRHNITFWNSGDRDNDDQRVVDKRLRFINNILKINGIDSVLNDWKLTIRFMVFATVFLISYATDVYYFLLRIVLYNISIAEFVEDLTFIQTQSVTVYRLWLFVRYRKTFRKLVHYIVVDFPKWINDRTSKLLEENSKTGMWIYNAHLAQLVTVSSLLTIRPLFSNTRNATPMHPPMGMLPFVPVDRTPWYELVYIYQVWKIVVQISTAFCVNMIYFICSTKVTAHIDCVALDLEDLNGESGAERASETIAIFVERHNSIKTCIDLLDRLFYVLTAIQPIYTAVSIITSLLVFDGTEQSYSFMGIAVAHVFEFFIYCYGGELITEKCVALSNKLFQVEWYNLHLKDKKNILTAMILTKKPSKIRSGFLGYYSRDMFSTTMKTTYSVWAVVKQVKK